MSYGVSRYSLPKLDPVCTLPATHKISILRDLIRKNPAGPIGVLEIYRDSSIYKPEHLKGYDPTSLFRLGVRDKDALRQEVSRMIYPGWTEEDLKLNKKSGIVTRYVNRAWPTLRSAILSVKSIGGPGVYELYDYGSSIHTYGVVGYVYACDMNTAIIIGKTTFGFVKSSTSFRARFLEWENSEFADILNLGLMASLSENITQMSKRKEEIEKSVNHNSLHIEALTNIVHKANN